MPSFYTWNPNESEAQEHTAQNQGDIDSIAASADGSMVLVTSSSTFAHWQLTTNGLKYRAVNDQFYVFVDENEFQNINLCGLESVRPVPRLKVISSFSWIV